MCSSPSEKLRRRDGETVQTQCEKAGGIQPEVPAILSSPAMSTSAGGNKSPGDATPLQNRPWFLFKFGGLGSTLGLLT
ncbi:hypothetical protein Bca52824_086782 [Brassica carinata]|uniref:Uncharacterized protein n=1 Tax=Brassica carinata TaxID=52824 RepID=A0A8X7TMJ7_BRACI|nr:hypothetical protein Bca52824_086782 [Brassica carinata]